MAPVRWSARKGILCVPANLRPLHSDDPAIVDINRNRFLMPHSEYGKTLVMLLFFLLIPLYLFAQVELEPAFPNLKFNHPVDLQCAGDGSGRIFVVEQQGRIYVFENDENVSSASLFLDITGRVNDSGNEEGLLGLAFHPRFSSKGYFYVDYTAANPRRTVIARYTKSPDNPGVADRNSEYILLEVPQPDSNHNGGQIAFGPDSMLYAAFGDGGSAGDPAGNGQNRRTLLGSIIRINVDAPDAGMRYGIPPDNPFYGNTEGYRAEIYAYGLRNPWRFSFDTQTGRMWAADVGQNSREEIDIIRKGGNYGWNIMEGTACYSPSSGCDTAGLTLPVWEYGRELGASVTGGYVYRGTQVPELTGTYIFADYVSGRIWSLQYDDVNPASVSEIMDTGLFISSFGTDENGELYICAFDGNIYRFKPTVTAVAGDGSMPAECALLQNYPNPFNADTRIRFRIGKTGITILEIYDINGRLIRNLESSYCESGEHARVWDGRNNAGHIVSSGIYLYRLRTAGGGMSVKKMVMIK